jgi:hypothetical protein
VNHKYLDALRTTDPRRAALLQKIGDGKANPSSYIFAKEYGGNLMADVSAAYPDWDQTKSQAYMKARESFESGKDKKELEGINTALVHASDAYSHATLMGLNGSQKLSTEATQYSADISRLTEEVNSAYTSGVLHKDERDDLLSGLKSPFPSVAKAAIQEYVKLLAVAKVDAKYNTWQNAKPSKAIPDYQIINPLAAQAYKKVMGQDIDPKYRGSSATQQPQQQQAPIVPKGTQPAYLAGKLVGYRDAQGNVTRF